MKHSLPALGYDYGALEPYIDAQTMEIHHTKHHQAYVDNLNKALEGRPELQEKKLSKMLSDLSTLPESICLAVRNHGGGHLNHSFFWQLMKKDGGGMPVGSVATEIDGVFGSFAAFQEQFNTAAKKVFGSGWAWLCVDNSGKLVVTSTPNQDTPISAGLYPILGLDVWEHAYYLKYQNKRPDYIAAWWHVIDWERVLQEYENVIG